MAGTLAERVACACPACTCQVAPDTAVRQGGQFFCSEACATGHQQNESCHDACGCGCAA